MLPKNEEVYDDNQMTLERAHAVGWVGKRLLELQDQGVQVPCVLPDRGDVEMQLRVLPVPPDFMPTTADVRWLLQAMTPYGRVCEPENIDTVLNLLFPRY